MKTETIIHQTRCWVESVVIAYNLCPFAREPQEQGRVRYIVSEAKDSSELISDLVSEIELLRKTPITEIETTVLIHPYVLKDFFDYNDFLYDVDDVLDRNDYSGEFQVASLHPDYLFADAQSDDAQNYTNRSPYPVLHLLREESVSKALDTYQQPERIPERNIRIMEKYGAKHMQAMLAKCLEEKPS